MVNDDNNGDGDNGVNDDYKQFIEWINFHSYDSDSIGFDIEDCEEIEDNDDDDDDDDGNGDNVIEISSNVYDYFFKINSINLFKKIKLIIKQFYS